jgi:hypothetical protein
LPVIITDLTVGENGNADTTETQRKPTTRKRSKKYKYRRKYLISKSSSLENFSRDMRTKKKEILNGV